MLHILQTLLEIDNAKQTIHFFLDKHHLTGSALLWGNKMADLWDSLYWSHATHPDILRANKKILMFIVHLVPQNWQGGHFHFFIFMAEGNIMNIALQMTRVTMVTAVFAIVSLNKHTNISLKRTLFVFPRWCRLFVWGLQWIANSIQTACTSAHVLICGSQRKRYCACVECFSRAKFKN
jgi:hypothetical protein